MADCAIHERLLGQRIPPISADNTALEAICRIPEKIPKMAAFDIVKVYQFTSEEHYVDYEPTYWDFGSPTGAPTQGESCAYEVDTSKDSFTWVSWLERTKELQKQRIWICEQPNHLICNELDPEFKKPAIPAHVMTGSIQIPMIFTPVYTFDVSSDQMSEFDTSDEVFISSIVISWDPPSWEPPSWTPPDVSWVPPDTSWEPPSWDPPSWEPPSWEEPSFEMLSWTPEDPPYWWSMDDFKWCEEEAPEWYSEIPEWYSDKFVKQYIDTSMTCKWKKWNNEPNNSGGCSANCELKDNWCFCSSMVDARACELDATLNPFEKSSLALDAFKKHLGMDDEDTSDWCFEEPPWLNIVPENPDVSAPNVAGFDGHAQDVCDGITIDKNGECLEAGNGCRPAFGINPECVAQRVCQHVKASFGIKKKCQHGNITGLGSQSYHIKTTALEFDPDVLKSTDCFNIRVSKQGGAFNPGWAMGGDNGIFFSIVPKNIFEIDGSLSNVLRLEPENSGDPCSKMLFKRAGGEKGGFVVVENGKLKCLDFPSNKSILTYESGKFKWESLKSCDDQCSNNE